MNEKLREIERQIFEALRDAEDFQPHDEQWRGFVGRLDNAKVNIWHAMTESPEVVP